MSLVMLSNLDDVHAALPSQWVAENHTGVMWLPTRERAGLRDRFPEQWARLGLEL